MKKLLLLAVVALSLALLPLGMAQVATSGKVLNTTMTLADTEYHVSLGWGIKSFSVRCRGAYDVRLAFVAGETATRYVTIPSGQTYYSPPINSAVQLYLRCADAGQIVEIDYWN